MTADLARAFRDRPVLVTGHTGFKGSWLALWLKSLGARVTGYALAPPTNPSNFEVSDVGSELERSVEADVRDRGTLETVFEACAPDVVFHLAAQPLVQVGYDSPRETFEVNVMGTVNVLETVRRRGRPCVVVVITSDKCYENREQVWAYREHDALGGFDPYSASKGAAEIVAAAYRRSFFSDAQRGIRLATVRAGNVIGGGDWGLARIVPDMVASLSKGRPVPLRNPDAVRPWQHVLEPLGGYLLLAARMLTSDDPQWCGPWNFGPLPGQEASVRRLAEIFVREWGDGTWVDAHTPGQRHEAMTLRLAIDKATWLLGWRPKRSLEATVAETVRWYKAWHAGRRDLKTLCFEQIAQYSSEPSGP